MLSQLAVLAVLFASGDCFRASTDLKDQECQESQTNPEYFSELRSNAFITECSKKDVCLLMRQLDAYFYARCTQGWVGGLWKTARRQISGQWELQTTSELQEIGSSDYQGRMPKNPFQTYQEEDEGHPLHQVPCGLHHGFCHETRSFQQSRHQRRRGGQVHSGWQISHFCTAKEDGRPAVSWYILNILKLS